MRKLIPSFIEVPNCPKSVTKNIHIDANNLKPTRIEYNFFCEEGLRKIKLQTFGYDKVIANGCEGCPFISGVERG